MIEVHICPVLMRTVVFEYGKCTEKCDEQECAIMIAEKNKHEAERS